ncbi:MAG: hypothetical protein HC838_00790 [Spirulinaceae cyanobacterium RM2_2_10]|nr:hypothetical protein [Spirulinaceae cyanobacterium SM2_1_0]NJO18887.1 hypothetical protein [Spirulinaceae cyanobacterium RM2_2_10]
MAQFSALSSVVVAIALTLPLPAQAQTATPAAPAGADALQTLDFCEMPAPNEVQVLVTVEDATAFSRLFEQLQARWPDAAICLDAPTVVSQSQLWIRVATVDTGDRAASLAREVSTVSGYPAILRAFRAEG